MTRDGIAAALSDRLGYTATEDEITAVMALLLAIAEAPETEVLTAPATGYAPLRDTREDQAP